MSFVLRMISQGRWLYEPTKFPWLPENYPLADALLDLKTEKNKLSVYQVGYPASNLDDLNLDENQELKRVIIALASNRKYVTNFDYTLIDLNLLKELGIVPHKSNGDTPDDYINRSHHYDIVELSVTKLLALAKLIQTERRWKRVKEAHVRKHLIAGAKDLDGAKVNITDQKLRKEMGLRDIFPKSN